MMKIVKFLIFFLLISTPLSAHVVKNSTSELKVDGSKIHWIIKVHLNDYNLKFENIGDQIVKDYLSNRLLLDLGNQKCELNSIRMEKDLLKEVVAFDLNYGCLSSGDPLQVSYGLFYGDPDHKHFLKVDRNGIISSYTFSQSNTEAIFTTESFWNSFGSFLKLGFEHILLGFDHVLFVICLLFGARKFRTLLWLITSFTLSHSLSLALSVLNIVQLSSKIVEPAIAASIIFLAIWDLRNRDNVENSNERKMVFVTFFFGLIHGLGFSSILKEANLEQKNIILPLASFNVGVESGQILIIGIIYPLLRILYKKNEKIFSILKKLILSGIILISLYWMIERIFF